jgi:hypothetical protein
VRGRVEVVGYHDRLMKNDCYASGLIMVTRSLLTCTRAQSSKYGGLSSSVDLLFCGFWRLVENKHEESSLAFKFSTVPEDVGSQVSLGPNNMNKNLLFV